MQKFKSFEQIVDELEKHFLDTCLVSQGAECGLCLKECPVFQNPKFGLHKKDPQTVMQKMVELLRDGKASSEAYVMTYGCVGGCNNACERNCPADLNRRSLTISTARRLYEAHQGLPLHYFQESPGHRYHISRPLAALQMDYVNKIPQLRNVPENPEPSDIVLFNSCHTQGLPHLVLECIGILESMGIDFVTVGGGDSGVCCGCTATLFGQLDEAERVAEIYVSVFTRLGAKKVITLCDGCVVWTEQFLKQMYPVPFEAATIYEFLADNLDKLRFTEKVDKIVTLHDSCVSRQLDQFNMARKILSAIPGLNLVEMEHCKEESMCCGGTANIYYPETTFDRHIAKANEAMSTGAGTVATLCSACAQFFVSLEKSYPLDFKNIISLVAEGLGIHYEDKVKKILLTRDANGVMDVDNIISQAQESIEASDMSPAEIATWLRSSSYYIQSLPLRS